MARSGGPPTEATAMALTRKVWKAVGTQRAGNIHLKNMLEGGTVDLGVVVTCRQVGLLARRLGREEKQPIWGARRGTLPYEVKRALRKLGWEAVAPWVWKRGEKEDRHQDL